MRGYQANAKVEVVGGLVCVTITAPEAPETVLRLPKDLAISMAGQIEKAARLAPNSFVNSEILKETSK